MFCQPSLIEVMITSTVANWLSMPRQMTSPKKTTDQSWGKGICDRAWGNTTNTRPGPEIQYFKDCFYSPPHHRPPHPPPASPARARGCRAPQTRPHRTRGWQRHPPRWLWGCHARLDPWTCCSCWMLSENQMQSLLSWIPETIKTIICKQVLVFQKDNPLLFIS